MIGPGIQYVLTIAGTMIGGIGALTVRYVDIRRHRVRKFIIALSPTIEIIEQAWDAFDNQSRVTEGEYIEILESYFDERYGRSRSEQPEYITETSTSMMIEYPGGSERSPFNEREAWSIEKRMFYDWMIRRYTTDRGVLMIFFGFVLVAFGNLASLISLL